MTTVGFLGLGRMGAPMASRLVGHVDRLLVYDIAPAAIDLLVAKGAEAAGRQLGVKVEELGTPKDDAAGQIGVLETAAASKPAHRSWRSRAR